MALTTIVKRRRGTTAQHSTFTGLEGELTVDTSKKTVVVHDGVTAGGHALAHTDNPTFTGVVTVPEPDSASDDQTAATTAFVQSKLQPELPVGTIIMTGRSTPPPGYLKCDGAIVSRTTYSALFAAIGVTFGTGDGSTTFAIPELRGEFVRGWDDGRGVDGSRALGSAQSAQNLTHTHTVTDPAHNHGLTDPGHVHTATSNAGYTASLGVSAIYGCVTANTGAAATGISLSSAVTGLSVQNSGGSDMRPRNVALLHCIKY